MELARLTATVGTHTTARDPAGFDLIHAARGHGLPGMVKKLMQFRIRHAGAVLFEVLRPIGPLNVISNPGVFVLSHFYL